MQRKYILFGVFAFVIFSHHPNYLDLGKVACYLGINLVHVPPLIRCTIAQIEDASRNIPLHCCIIQCLRYGDLCLQSPSFYCVRKFVILASKMFVGIYPAKWLYLCHLSQTSHIPRLSRSQLLSFSLILSNNIASICQN